MKLDELISHLTGEGVTPDSIVRFDKTPGPRHVRYVDLLGEETNLHEILPDAVVESSGQPFVYVVRGDRLGDTREKTQTRLAELIRTLACRSDARYLGVVTSGTLEVYPLGIFEIPPPPRKFVSRQYPSSWRALLSGATQLFDTEIQQRASEQWLETLLFRLLVDAAEGIHRAAPRLTIQQVIALVGRALFFRFLVDRGIVTENDAPSICVNTNSLTDIFGNPAALIDTCTWLDKTFNGDLLSLGNKDYQSLIQIVGVEIQSVCWHLTNIQHRAVGGQLPLDWSGIKFRHVPVDVLSQVYEDFAHKFVPELARQTSVHFTPRQLAEVVIDGAFSAVQSALPHEAKVLDPAVGAGVFLVLAFRRLVAERWRALGKRPTRGDIRKILMTQLVGFDINRDALNIAALSLYLAALELDPTPNRLVTPFLANESVQLARHVPLDLINGWAFIEIQSPDHTSINKTQPDVENLTGLSEVAGVYWASQLCLHHKDGGELVGRLNQWRYWTRTQARLAAIDWVRNISLTDGARTT